MRVSVCTGVGEMPSGSARERVHGCWRVAGVCAWPSGSVGERVHGCWRERVAWPRESESGCWRVARVCAGPRGKKCWWRRVTRLLDFGWPGKDS